MPEKPKRRIEDDLIGVPVWAAPVLLTGFIILGLSYVSSGSAETAQKKVDKHASEATVRFDRLEQSDQKQNTDIQLIGQEIKYITVVLKEAGIEAKNNQKLLHKIAVKLDVDVQ
jgi:5-bromo-4-chloroindolyl phosphate hydrolysis protein